MSTLILEKTESQVVHRNGTPPLVAGDYLTRPEFERRYHAHPELKKAELIEGIVYKPSPVRANKHGDPYFDIISWLGFYRMTTPGIRGVIRNIEPFVNNGQGSYRMDHSRRATLYGQHR